MGRYLRGNVAEVIVFDRALSAAERETIKRWIESGAKYEPHWSFIPLAPVSVPAVKRAEWPRNDVDRFVLERLEREGLQPSAEAARETLLRRATLDLTGLPPTPAEVDAFVADQTPDRKSTRLNSSH